MRRAIIGALLGWSSLTSLARAETYAKPDAGPLETADANTKQVIPEENLSKKTRPKLEPAEAMAARLLVAIAKDDAKSVVDEFFPKDAFRALKDIKDPDAYHTQLVKWFAADIHKEHLRLKDLGPLVYDGFKAGNCVWRDKGSEGNRIAYWSCYRNKFYAKSSNGRQELDLKVMINWGPQWYVTHLGPIPKQH